MKKLIYSLSALALVSAVFFASCKKEVKPGFTPDATTSKVGKAVAFKDNEAERKNSSYTWDFGDGERSFERNPSHVYWVAGKYTVSQTVTINKNAEKGTGKTESSSVVITVTGPTASFTASATSINVNGAVTFTNTSTDATVYRWSYTTSFGTSWDGGITTTPDLAMNFSVAGTYTFRLWADVAGSTGNSASWATPVDVVVTGFTTPTNNNSAAKGMLYGKWTIGTDGFVTTYTTTPTGCSNFLPASVFTTGTILNHTSVTFNEDGTCWLVDPTGNQTVGTSGNWTMNSSATLLTITGTGGSAPLSGIGTAPNQSLPGGTFAMNLSSSSLTLTVIDICSADPSAKRTRTITASK